ncbi:MAG: alpha/beta hydrolase [Treponema sp.]|jgi:acetyl esterase/lipase|nr:alpha/beta hydrolase [Treponema sp.]
MRGWSLGNGRLEPCFEKDFDASGSVIICPGGAYRFLSPREAGPVARRFAQSGWRPYILRYPVGENLGTAPLEEAAAALRLVRERDAGAGVKKPVVVCGFSAGGHLAASLGVHWNNAAVFPDAASRALQRPDALVLAYPVISAGHFAHRESIDRLTGTFPAAGNAAAGTGAAAGKASGMAAAGAGNAPLVAGDFFSLEKHAGADTPPAFIWHTATDESVPVQNSLLFAEALVRAGTPVELHVFPRGAHGLSLATPDVDEPEAGRLSDAHVARWFDLCVEWLNSL